MQAILAIWRMSREAAHVFWARTGWPFAVGAVPLLVVFAWAWTLRSDALTMTAAIWTAATAWGTVTSVWTLREAWLERVALNRALPGRNGVLRMIANANVRREVLRVVAQGALLIIGLSVLVDAMNALMSRSLLILVAATLVANSVLDRIERRVTAAVLRRALVPKAPTEKS